MKKKNKNQQLKNICNTKDETLKKFNRITRNIDTKTCFEISKFIEEECNKYGLEVEKSCKKTFADITEALDRNFSAALIEKTELSLDQIKAILERACDLISEDNKKIKNLQKEGKGNWMKAVDKYVEEINDIAVELLDKGESQKEIIQTLKDKFPKLSATMITNAFKKIKEMHSNKKEDHEAIEDAVSYIFEEKNKKQEIDAEDELEIKKITLEVKGKFGMYKLENNIVQVDDVKFTSEANVEEVYRAQLRTLEMQKNEVLKVYKLAKKQNME